ncbi:RICIN domain-containing protein [Streptomyces xanthophaeus]|uniref:RICIN domain-containing protein n=1 Tax=Streptomyces xanthophaeus TaxID=67385 RepID=UPI00371540CA
MFRRIALTIGSLGLLATCITGTASAAPAAQDPAPFSRPADSAPVPQLAVPQPSGKGLPRVISPADAARIDASADPAAAAATTAGPLFIQNFNSAKCLVAQGTANSTTLFQYGCAFFDDQYWYAVMDSSGYVQLKNYNSGKCMVVQGTANGAQAFQYTCGNWADQQWALDLDTTDTYVMLRNRNSGKCLVLQGKTDGAVPFQFSCNGAYGDQWWKFV